MVKSTMQPKLFEHFRLEKHIGFLQGSSLILTNKIGG